MNVLCLVKFFRNEAHLDALIAGQLYCNTPEFYRVSKQEGAADLNESCVYSYRQARGDPDVKVMFNDIELTGLVELTMHGGSSKDMWLHCWTALEIPQGEAELKQLVADLNRLRNEFGGHFAVMPHFNIRPFVHRVRELTKHQLVRGPVRYTKNKLDWNVACKAAGYSYQREYRFGVGSCGRDLEPLTIEDPRGFGQFIFKNHVLRITDAAEERVWFQLDRDNCFETTTSSST